MSAHTHTHWKASMFMRAVTAPECVRKQTTHAHTLSTRSAAVFITCPTRLARSLRGLIQLQSSGGDLCSRGLRQSAGEERKTRGEMARRACLGAPHGDGVLRRCTDSFGEGEALRSCCSGSSGRPGRLTVLTGPDL